ncbi:MAG: DUF4405 domain-containing protein [Chthoniobacterales bacterium]
MNTKRLRIIVDIALWFLFCFLLGTGLLIHYRLVPGFKGGHGLEMFDMSRHEWGAFHLWTSYLFLAFLSVHLILNWSFIKNAIAKRIKWRALVLCVLGLSIVGFFLVAPISQNDAQRERGKGRGRENHATDHSKKDQPLFVNPESELSVR